MDKFLFGNAIRMPYNEFREVIVPGKNLYYSHKSQYPGYVRRERGMCWVETYHGRLGNGVRVHLPAMKTNNHYVEYWFEDDDEQEE